MNKDESLSTTSYDFVMTFQLYMYFLSYIGNVKGLSKSYYWVPWLWIFVRLLYFVNSFLNDYDSCRIKGSRSLMRGNEICVSFDFTSCFIVGYSYSLEYELT